LSVFIMVVLIIIVFVMVLRYFILGVVVVKMQIGVSKPVHKCANDVFAN
jgi:hypothetical protein